MINTLSINEYLSSIVHIMPAFARRNWLPMKKALSLVFLLLSFFIAWPQSRELAAAAMNISGDSTQTHPDVQSMVLKGIESAWLNTADGKYFRYIQHALDTFISKDGGIRNYDPSRAGMADIDKGAALMLLYNATGQERYWKAATTLYEQLQGQSRSGNGIFRHDASAPSFTAYDLYSWGPFYASYARIAHNDTAFNDIARQFTATEKLVRDPATGLLFYRNAIKMSGTATKSASFMTNAWQPGMGSFGMALADVLEEFPAQHPQRGGLTAILQRYAEAVKKIYGPANAKTGLLSSPADAMFIYTLAKGVRLGLLPSLYATLARERYNSLMKQLHVDSGQVYLSAKNSKAIAGDPLTIGALLQAANEMDLEATQSTGKGRTVLLDNFFNHEVKKDITGRNIDWHYKWNEWTNGGFSLLGHAFRKYGVRTEQLDDAPTAAHLKSADIFIIVDPDTKKESDPPNYILPQHIDALYNWVKEGGVLVLMGNDTGNAEFEHFNELAGRFGIHFNEDSRNRVQGKQYEMGAFYLTNNEVLPTTKKIYMKEVATLGLTAPARPVLTDKGDVILAVSKLGRGTVFAVGDPWIYNEYTDGRILTSDYENYQAAKDLIRWLIRQCPKLKGPEQKTDR